MRLEQLQYFLEIADGKSISKTAEDHYISQSAVSESLKKLEQEVGVSLLNKHNSRVTVSLAGQEFYNVAKSILNTWQDGLHTMQKYQNIHFDQLKKTLCISISHGISSDIFYDLLIKLQTNCPNINITVSEKDFYNCICSVANGQSDFSIVLAYKANLNDTEVQDIITSNALLTEILLNSNASALVGPESPFASKKQISVKDLLKQRLSILNSNLEKKWICQSLSSFGTPNIAFVTDNKTLLMQHLLNNPQAISLGCSLLGKHHDLVKAIPLKENIPIVALYVTRHENQHQYNAYRILTKNYFDNLCMDIKQ